MNSKERRGIAADKARMIRAKHREDHQKYIEGFGEPRVVLVEPGLGRIIDMSLLEENSGSQGWCSLPYKLASSTNKLGCPNHGAVLRSLRGFEADVVGRVIRECPPTRFLTRTIFDLERPVYVIFNVFPVGQFAEDLRQSSQKLKTPGGWYNFRYWQNVARKELYEKCTEFLHRFPGTIVDLCPEAHGVDLTKVMVHLGIDLEFGVWPPAHHLENVRYQICLGGCPKDEQKLIEAGLLGSRS